MSRAAERKRQAALKVTEQLARGQMFVVGVMLFLVVLSLLGSANPIAVWVAVTVGALILIAMQVTRSKYRDIAAQITPSGSSEVAHTAAVRDRLAELDQLRDDGAITDEEYAVQRERLLNDL